MTYACPKCSSTDLRIAVSFTYGLRSDGEVYRLDEPYGPDYDGESATLCNACEHTGCSREFCAE